MFEIFNEHYYIDLSKIEDFVELTKIHSTEIKEGESPEMQINLIKFDLIKMLLEVLFNEVNDIDEKMGLSSNEISVSFKLAFNTLLNYKIINRY